MIKRVVIFLAIAVISFFMGMFFLATYPVLFLTVHHWFGISDQPQYEILYYDRNGDGIVDLEIHHSTNSSDSDWGLIDTDFNASYDILFVSGVGFDRYPVEVPVPGGVRLSKQYPKGYSFP